MLELVTLALFYCTTYPRLAKTAKANKGSAFELLTKTLLFTGFLGARWLVSALYHPRQTFKRT